MVLFCSFEIFIHLFFHIDELIDRLIDRWLFDELVDCLYFLQFDLVCDKAIYGTVSSSLIFVGWLLGAMVVGTLADKFGRKIMVYIFGFFVALFSLLSAFPNVYWLFALFRFIVGFSIGMYPCRAQLLCRSVAAPRPSVLNAPPRHWVDVLFGLVSNFCCIYTFLFI